MPSDNDADPTPAADGGARPRETTVDDPTVGNRVELDVIRERWRQHAEADGCAVHPMVLLRYIPELIAKVDAVTAELDAHRTAAREVAIQLACRARAAERDRDAAVAEREALRRAVGAYHNLLARIFRDGGQRQDAIGDDARAGEAAEGIVVGYVAALDAAVGERDAMRRAVEGLPEIVRRCGDPGPGGIDITGGIPSEIYVGIGREHYADADGDYELARDVAASVREECARAVERALAPAAPPGDAGTTKQEMP